ncbi:hypothetical protein EDC96DRAFT_540146 [Choanephora cucurbitarum]|nr:hypothetical protein EDC96DRAFT_540146 [Choanephora cucurbitarum]
MLLTILLFFSLDSSKLTNTSLVNAPTYCVFQVKSLLLWLSPMNLYRLRTKADAAFHTPIEANYCHRLVPSSDDSSVIDRPGSTHKKKAYPLRSPPCLVCHVSPLLMNISNSV